MHALAAAADLVWTSPATAHFLYLAMVVVSGTNGTYLGGAITDAGWVRHAVCAVTHRMCRQALIKKSVVLLRNAWWVTPKTLTHPTFLQQTIPLIAEAFACLGSPL
jgi:hypothetical protein